MYTTLLQLHSVFRWLVLLSLCITLYRCYIGLSKQRKFTRTDNFFRHTTATIAHIQLVFGIILYTQSPVVKYFWQNLSEASHDMDMLFFGLIHIVLMISAIIMITIGSALAKRKRADTEKFKTIVAWYSIGLFIILVAIPWPFSPLSIRPYIR